MGLLDIGSGQALVPRSVPWVDSMGLDRRAQSAPGSAQNEQGIGITSFFTAFVVAIIIFVVQATLFMLLRNKLSRIL